MERFYLILAGTVQLGHFAFVLFAYEGSFVAHWVSRIMYFEAPPSAFVIAYSLFGILVLFSWFWVRPRGFRSRKIKTTS